MTEQPAPCRTTRHCVHHDFCHRCTPSLTVASRYLVKAISAARIDDERKGGVYDQLAATVRDAARTASGQQPETGQGPDPCSACPDGHTPADLGSQPWAVWVSDHRDGDGQPAILMVARTGGAHVAESDAEWMRARLNDRADRAAILREAADAIEQAAGDMTRFRGSQIAAELRRMAGEARS